ncbi:bleomycin resistance protein [Elizabethkingia anophelis]|uniref:Bleomycin resistance protein n=1 Tax=Elizabethkingia anophelis R26 TaxID=1246994 RepID=A0ABN5BUC3_9FLAO|nr:VOC family protein [Elizabethkingia anophelis]ATC35401.1 VOC family protein [Elizabethkingia anophelis R26]ATC39039.1 VOC family protein [Elizabethkingia anophelis Ag1]ATC42720.1 VOC family protein [Elizabethkingia anophelis]ATC46396.1 VOC family protein [Elizabethkingia anophelis]ELR78785.1 glyoxalase family protein [Elizabethkingia anophelis R26]
MGNDKTIKFNRLIPELLVSSIEASKVFYVEQLGFTIEYERREDDFALILYEGSQFMLEQDHATAWITGELGSIRGRGINFQIEVDCLDTVIAKIETNDLPYFRKSKEQWYRINTIEEGVKELLIQDPDGYLLRFQQYLGEREILE